MHKQAVEVWMYFYKYHTKENYIFSGKDGMHLKQLLKKVEAKVKERGLEPTEDNILNSLKGFLNTVKDPWILDHLEVSLINSKFNSLYVSAIKHSPVGIQSAVDAIVNRRNSKRATGT